MKIRAANGRPALPRFTAGDACGNPSPHDQTVFV
jgi:hypothetical protein